MRNLNDDLSRISNQAARLDGFIDCLNILKIETPIAVTESKALLISYEMLLKKVIKEEDA
jgi:hypothetical protein